MAKLIMSPLGRMEHEPPHYQDLLGEVIKREKPQFVIESGCESGFGAEFLLVALDANQYGHLYSFDPKPHGLLTVKPIIHDRFTLIKEYSYDIMVPFFLEHGPYDLFLHDSDHGPGCQTFEYELAWKLLKRGGILATDDRWWGIGPDSIPHKSWEAFLKRNDIPESSVVVINNAVYIKKPDWATEPKVGDKAWAMEQWRYAAQKANEASMKWGQGIYIKNVS